MALIGGLLTALGKIAGRVANMALGWASILLFGQVPQSKQSLLTVITLGSLAWVGAVAGVLVPDVGNFILTAIPRPDFVPELWVRIAMIVVALVLPLLIGVATIFLMEPDVRPKGAGLVVQVLRGYLYAPALAFMLIFLGVIALVRKGRSLVKRWEDAHVPAMVKPGGYEAVVADLESALDGAGLHVERTRAPRTLEIPPRLLGAIGGAAVRGLIPDELAQLKRDGLEILVYPSDIALLGTKELVARARAAIARSLTFTDAYLTTTKESQKIEDRLTEISRAPAIKPTDFERIDKRLASLVIPYDEWETIYRLRLQVENEVRLPDASNPAGSDLGGPQGEGAGPSGASRREGRQQAGRLEWATALSVVALFVLDIVLMIRGGRAAR